MSRRKGGKRRQRPAQRRSGSSSGASAIVEVDGLPGVRMTLEILDMTPADVEEARRQAALCNVEHPLVKRMVCALVHAFKLQPAGPEWSVGELGTLLQALRLLPEWTSPVDVELAHMLASAVLEQGGGS